MHRICFTYFLLFSVIWTSCKKERKIDVSGRATDEYTGLPVSNARVVLSSEITGGRDARYNTYITHTDNNGFYSFKNAYFSRPVFYGSIEIAESYTYISTKSGVINKSDAKWIGHTKLVRDLQVISLAKLNLTVNVTTPNYNYLNMYAKFIGSRPLSNGAEFGGVGFKSIYGGDEIPSWIWAYPDGITVYKIEIHNQAGAVIKVQYDTLVSQGFGSTNAYTININ